MGRRWRRWMGSVIRGKLILRGTSVFCWGSGEEGMGVSGAALDFRAFLLRGHSLRLYRAALRSARRAPAYSREDLERSIREEFEVHRFEGNAQTIRFLLSDGLQRLKQLNTMLGIQGHEDHVGV